MLRKAIIILFLILPFKILATDLVVTEIMYDVDGADSGQEWIELYNLGQDNLMVTSTWRFFDSSNHKINLYQGTSSIASQEFFILADNPENFLNIYPNFSGNLFDTVINLPNSSSGFSISLDEGATYALNESYDSNWGANGDGYSLEKIDFLANASDNWHVSSILGGTPGEVNSEAITEEEIVLGESVVYDYSSLVINEIMPNPVGSDDGEWIELYNNGEEIINLEGLKIKDNSTRVFSLDSDVGIDLNLGAHNYLVLDKSLTGISLNNSSGDSVILLDSSDNVISSISYTNAFEGYSYAKSDNGFMWSKTPSKGQVNIISVNQAPVAQISVEESDFLVGEKINFSGEYSYDPEGDDIDYLWEFGDGENSSRSKIKHSFANLGTYIIRLTVTDTYGETNSTEYTLIIGPSQKEEKDIVSEEKIAEIKIDVAEDDLIISEFMPNPVGSDDNEWIELYNSSDKDIDLYSWQLDDSDGGSKKWKVATSTIIKSQDYLVFNREETKITLNNSSDSVRLFTPSEDLWQEIEYQKIPEGKSYAFDDINNEWFVTEASLGQKNTFQMEKIEETIHDVASIKDLSKNDYVSVQGITLNKVDKDSRSLYLVDYNFSEVNFEEIIEIYSYYKNFPDILPGQLVTIRGQISKLDDISRIKIKNQEDILLNDLKIDLTEPGPISIDDLDEDFLGSHIKVKGTVVKKSGKNIYLAISEDEDYILRIYTKFSTKSLDIKKGDDVIVAGLLSISNDIFKLEPFVVGDISVSKQVLGEKIENEEQEISTSTYNVVADNNKNNVRNILIFIGAFLLIIIIIVYIKHGIIH